MTQTILVTENDDTSIRQPFAGSVQYVAPVANQTIQIADSTDSLILDPSGNVAGVTVVMPVNPAGQGVSIAVGPSGNLTTLVQNPAAGQSIANGNLSGTVAANATTSFSFAGNPSKWFVTT